MIKPFDIPVWGPSKNVPQDDAQYTMNLYPEKVSEDVYTLKARAGNVVTGSFGFAGGGRDQISVNGRHFGIRGYDFCEFVDGASVTLGNLVTNEGTCEMVACLPPNEEGQILIVGPGSKEGYVFELATSAFTVLDEATHGFVGGGGQCVFFGGRAWVLKVGSGQFQCSDPYNFLSWPGDAFGTTEFDSDELLAIDTNGNYLLLLGRYTGEMWVFQDTTPLPVQATNSTFRIGILAPQAHTCFENDFYWFGGNAEGKGVVYSLSAGGEPQIISDYSVIRNISQIAVQTDAFMFAYQDLGHRFIFLTFPTANRTFVYDLSEGLWHEESTRLVPSGFFACLPWQSVIFHAGKLLGLNRDNGQIAEIRDGLYTDNGNPIILDRKLSVIPKEATWKSYFQSVELFTEMGNAPLPSSGESENVVVGTILASNPVLIQDVRYYLVDHSEFGVYSVSGFANAADRLAGVDPVGTGTGDIGEAGTVTISGVASIDFSAIEESDLPFSFDVMEQITQSENAPNIMLRISRDRGKTWGTEQWKTQSGNGSYVCRAQWTGLGSAFGITLWFRFVANQYVSFRGIRVYAEGGG